MGCGKSRIVPLHQQLTKQQRTQLQQFQYDYPDVVQSLEKKFESKRKICASAAEPHHPHACSVKLLLCQGDDAGAQREHSRTKVDAAVGIAREALEQFREARYQWDITEGLLNMQHQLLKRSGPGLDPVLDVLSATEIKNIARFKARKVSSSSGSIPGVGKEWTKDVEKVYRLVLGASRSAAERRKRCRDRPGKRIALGSSKLGLIADYPVVEFPYASPGGVHSVTLPQFLYIASCKTYKEARTYRLACFESNGEGTQGVAFDLRPFDERQKEWEHLVEELQGHIDNWKKSIVARGRGAIDKKADSQRYVAHNSSGADDSYDADEMHDIIEDRNEEEEEEEDDDDDESSENSIELI